MPTRQRNAKGHFVKGHKTTTHRKRSKSTAMVRHSAPVVVTRYRTASKPHHKRRSRRSGGGGGGVNLGHVALAGAGLAFLAGPQSPIKAIPENLAKVPGSKTFGNVAIGGAACLVVDRFVKRNKWLRYAGIVGVVLGAVQVGTQGTEFKWLGDADGGAGDDGPFIGDLSED
jgi:hypothetical protein